ncbi:putative fructosyl amino acid oxidase [Aspergillus steynii IBT 23096]|uniref:Putative fructosyl amino acid oxidase n=1 Tax=Aspergillus steynii IBT 23096 TaxID=1392250 RepID=A0A2I2G074_9EURO|nr:putative fructosyl amino acid oxidase [Aspergillus steynii IBT 23096]PLB46273.1 putative fructosyl amino acid oxidase [Aspergillus steynii IBT 23096]
MNLDTKILIVGGGAFGTSTAYNLAQRGYRSVRVLDRYAAPSLDAASTDISKIIRSDYNEPLYAAMGLESIAAWRTWDMFKDLYAVPGWILSAANLSIPFVEGSIETSTRLGVQGLERVAPDQIRAKFPQITGELDGWEVNVWNPTAGWAKSGEALRRMALAAQANGVQYISGDRGYVRKLVFSTEGCRGVVTQDGTTYEADVVIVAAGAWTPSLVDVGGQLTAKGHAVAHIQLTPDETRHYRSLPILDNLELGYFLPVQEDGIFKLAHSQFITNTETDPVSGITTSIPHTFVENPRDDLPPEIERTMRRNLRRVFPELADRPFCFTRLCWDADTADRHFLVTPHPDLQGLFLATGGSAHGFKFLPVLGRYIADALEGTLDQEILHQWRWRPGITVSADNLAHLDPEIELNSLRGWRCRREEDGGLSKL